MNVRTDRQTDGRTRLRNYVGALSAFAFAFILYFVPMYERIVYEVKGVLVHPIIITIIIMVVSSSS